MQLSGRDDQSVFSDKQQHSKEAALLCHKLCQEPAPCTVQSSVLHLSGSMLGSTSILKHHSVARAHRPFSDMWQRRALCYEHELVPLTRQYGLHTVWLTVLALLRIGVCQSDSQVHRKKRLHTCMAKTKQLSCTEQVTALRAKKRAASTLLLGQMSHIATHRQCHMYMRSHVQRRMALGL